MKGSLSQDIIVLVLVRVGLSDVEARTVGDWSAEAGALGHSTTAAQSLAYHRQTARTLGHDTTVPTNFGTGLLQR